MISCDIFIDNGILQQHMKLDSQLSNKNLNISNHSWKFRNQNPTAILLQTHFVTFTLTAAQ